MELDKIINKRKMRLKKEIRNIFLIVLSLLVFRSVFYEPYRIPTGSMIPTLRIGDFILVNKYKYGFKLPFSDMAIFEMNFNPIYLFGKSSPERGDVIVFKYPKDTSVNYVKRVIGLPGDSIEIRDKIVYINDVEVGQVEFDGQDLMKDMDEKFKSTNLKFYETQIEKHHFIIQQDVDNIYSTHLDRTLIPEGKYFVMGDNRDFSYDSRFWGFVPHEYIRGEAILVWLSMSMPDQKDQFSVRLNRIFKSID